MPRVNSSISSRPRFSFGALAVEQLVVLAFGTLVGIATGLAATVLVLRDVPEFLTQPAAPPLVYLPAAVPLAALLAVTVAALLAVSVLATATLIRGVRLDQLREAPP